MDPLRKCQIDAIENFEYYYYGEDDNDRGIISMCCGAGKTRTTYEIIKLCIKNHDEHFFIIATSRKELIYQVTDEYLKFKKIEDMDYELKIVGGSGEQYPE